MGRDWVHAESLKYIIAHLKVLQTNLTAAMGEVGLEFFYLQKNSNISLEQSIFLINCIFWCHIDIILSDGLYKEVWPSQVLVMSALSIWSPHSNLWHWGIHMCLMFYSWNALRRKEVLTHWSPAPSSGALWEGGRISGQYLQWPFPLTGQRPMGKNWRRQTMNNRVQGWAMVPAQHVPLRDVDYLRLGGHRKDQGIRSVPQEHLGHLLRNSALFRNTTCNHTREEGRAVS